MAWTNRRRCFYIGFLAALGLVTTACHTKPPPPPPTDIPPGSTLRVLLPIPVAADSTDAYFQDAQLVVDQLGSINPYCQFVVPKSALLPSIAGSGNEIGLDTYTVQSSEYNAREKGRGDRFVSSVQYALTGSTPSATAQLKCVVPDVSADDRFPTPQEIVGALGSYFELKLAQ